MLTSCWSEQPQLSALQGLPLLQRPPCPGLILPGSSHLVTEASKHRKARPFTCSAAQSGQTVFTLELPTSMEPTSQLNFFPYSILLLSLPFGLYLKLCTLTISLHLPPENTTCNRKLTDTQGYRRACFRSRDISLLLFLPKRQ